MESRLHTRENSGILLDREGRFWHDGEPVEHPGVLRAFHQGIERDAQGRYLLRFGNDWCFFQVEDAPYQAVAAALGRDVLALTLDDGSSELCPLDRLVHSPEGVLYGRVKSGRMLARFSRSAQAGLAEALEVTDDGGFAFKSGGRLWQIASR